VAEEIVFNQLTTGAGNDIKTATVLARKMVMEWGMSQKLGPLAYGENDENPFLGRDMTVHHATYSNQTARLIDEEVQELVISQYNLAKKILIEDRELLDRVAEALLDQETLDGADIDLLAEGKPLPKRELIRIPTYSEKARDAKEKRKSSGIFGSPRPATS